MSTMTAVAIVLISFGLLCFLFILIRFAFFARNLRQALVDVGWGQNSGTAPAIIILLAICVAIAGSGWWLIVNDYDGEMQKLASALSTSQAQTAASLGEIEKQTGRVQKLIDSVRRLDTEYYLAFEGGPEDLNVEDMETQVYRARVGQNAPELHKDAEIIQGAGGGLVAKVHDVAFGDRIFIIAKLKNGKTWKSLTIEVPAAHLRMRPKEGPAG